MSQTLQKAGKNQPQTSPHAESTIALSQTCPHGHLLPNGDLQRLKQNDVNLLVRLLDSAVEQDGIDAVAKRLQEHSEEIAAIMQKVMYESGGDYRTTGVHGMQIELTKFAAILKGAPLDASESLYLTDLQESMNYSYDPGVDDEPDYDVYL